jgi:hypothetical protein
MASKVGMNPNHQITENLMNDYQNEVSLIQTFVRMCNDYQIQVFLIQTLVRMCFVRMW